MSEHSKEKDAPNSDCAMLDSTSAAAALALAVTSAEKAGDKPVAAEPAAVKPTSAETTTAVSAATKPPPAETVPVATRSHLPAGWQTHAARAAAIALAVGLGWAGGSVALSGGKQIPRTLPEWTDAATSSIRQNHDDVVRLTADVRVLKGMIESMKDGFDQTRDAAAGQQRALMERVDGIERTAQDTTAKIAVLTEASARVERASIEVGAKLGALSDRHNAKAAAEGPAQTGSVPDAKASAKLTPVEGWVLREVYGGVALVEARNGRLHEVVPGQMLPSVGRVEAIERRGRAWVVVTSKGVIGAPERWQ